MHMSAVAEVTATRPASVLAALTEEEAEATALLTVGAVAVPLLAQVHLYPAVSSSPQVAVAAVTQAERAVAPPAAKAATAQVVLVAVGLRSPQEAAAAQVPPVAAAAVVILAAPVAPAVGAALVAVAVIMAAAEEAQAAAAELEEVAAPAGPIQVR